MDVFQGLFFAGFLLIPFPPPPPQPPLDFSLIYWGLRDAKNWLGWSFGLISSGILHQERNGRIKEV